MKLAKFINAPTERLALIYSDDSAGILHEGSTFEDACAERLFADKGNSDMTHKTRIAKVRIMILEIIDG